MKKLIPFLILLTLVLASCSKEKKVDRYIEGTWTLTSYKIDQVDHLDDPDVKMGLTISNYNSNEGDISFTYDNSVNPEQTFTGTFYLTEENSRIKASFPNGISSSQWDAYISVDKHEISIIGEVVSTISSIGALPTTYDLFLRGEK